VDSFFRTPLFEPRCHVTRTPLVDFLILSSAFLEIKNGRPPPPPPPLFLCFSIMVHYPFFSFVAIAATLEFLLPQHSVFSTSAPCGSAENSAQGDTFTGILRHLAASSPPLADRPFPILSFPVNVYRYGFRIASLVLLLNLLLSSPYSTILSHSVCVLPPFFFFSQATACWLSPNRRFSPPSDPLERILNPAALLFPFAPPFWLEV